MIDNVQRRDLAAKIAEHITSKENDGMIGGRAGLVTGPQAWYIDATDTARSALVVGFYGDMVILATVGSGQVLTTSRALVWLDYEEALCESAARQKKKLQDAQAEYLSTCEAVTKRIVEKRRAAKAEG